ncbi:unnamed protein product [Nyctereutes procyonoides]|uniref:(raccoon dog) hypothetical protein n=1 Tax=Nyctereutes procyonoides TaxID=34880 RepID=A0A811ZWG0_NYCPR|nr:unnamed protein product [Nyctereutes procyonoides]
MGEWHGTTHGSQVFGNLWKIPSATDTSRGQANLPCEGKRGSFWNVHRPLTEGELITPLGGPKPAGHAVGRWRGSKVEDALQQTGFQTHPPLHSREGTHIVVCPGGRVRGKEKGSNDSEDLNQKWTEPELCGSLGKIKTAGAYTNLEAVRMYWDSAATRTPA